MSLFLWPTFSGPDQTWVASLGLCCWFKISTRSANRLSCYTPRLPGPGPVSSLSVPVCLCLSSASRSSPPVSVMYAPLSQSCLTVCVRSSVCLLVLRLINLFPSNWDPLHPEWGRRLWLKYSTPQCGSSRLKSHTCSAAFDTSLHNKPTVTVTKTQLTWTQQHVSALHSHRQLWVVCRSFKSLILCVCAKKMYFNIVY